MAKATLTFDLPDEEEKFNRACAAPDLFAALREYDEDLRRATKYQELPEDEARHISAARQALHDILRERGIDL